MNFGNKAKGKLHDRAKKIAVPVSEEVLGEVKKIPETVIEQITGKKDQPSPIVEAMKQGGGEMSAEEVQKREVETKRNLEKLEEEMQKARVERAQQEKEWQERQQEIFSDPGKPMEEVLVMPPSKPSRGDPNAASGGGKSSSPETRKSKH